MTLAANSGTSFSSTANRATSRRRRSASTSTLAISLVTLVALIALWFLAAHFEWASPLFLPSPAEVLTQFSAVWVDGYANGTLLEHTLASLGRIAAALGVGIFMGIPLGLLMGLNRWVKGIFSVPIDLYWGLPPLAYLPLLIIWLGIGETSKITLLFLAALPVSAVAARDGVRNVAVTRLHVAQSLGANRWQIFRHVVFPSALAEIFTGARLAVGIVYGTLIAAEIIAGSTGIGWMILVAH